MLKKIFLGMVISGISISAFAGAPKDLIAMPTGVNLLAPDSAGTWALGVEALYVRASGSDLQYAINLNGSTPVQTIHDQTVNQTSHWGGTIDFDYLFPGSSRDLKFIYTHIEMPDSSYGSDFLFNETKGHVRDNYNAGDILFGQWIRIGERVDLHPFAGLRYASIDMNGKVTNGISSIPFLSYFNAKLDNDFHGIGPRLGIDAVAHVGSDISIVSTVGASLLIGDLESKYVLTLPVVAATANEKNDTVRQTVPEVDARLGIHDDYHINPGVVLGFELGCQAVNYFDVTQLNFLDTVVPNTTHKQENFAYYGPYLRLQLAVN